MESWRFHRKRHWSSTKWSQLWDPAEARANPSLPTQTRSAASSGTGISGQELSVSSRFCLLIQLQPLAVRTKQGAQLCSELGTKQKAKRRGWKWLWRWDLKCPGDGMQSEPPEYKLHSAFHPPELSANTSRAEPQALLHASILLYCTCPSLPPNARVNCLTATGINRWAVKGGENKPSKWKQNSHAEGRKWGGKTLLKKK